MNHTRSHTIDCSTRDPHKGHEVAQSVKSLYEQEQALTFGVEDLIANTLRVGGLHVLDQLET